MKDKFKNEEASQISRDAKIKAVCGNRPVLFSRGKSRHMDSQIGNDLLYCNLYNYPNWGTECIEAI